MDNTGLNLTFCCNLCFHDFISGICSSQQAVKYNQLSHINTYTHTSIAFFFPANTWYTKVMREKVLKGTFILNSCNTSTNVKWPCTSLSCYMHCINIPSYNYPCTFQWVIFSAVWIIPISLQVLKTLINPDFRSDIMFEVKQNRMTTWSSKNWIYFWNY